MLKTRFLLAPLFAIGCLSPLSAQDSTTDQDPVGCAHNVVVSAGEAQTITSNHMDCGSVEVSVNGFSGSQEFEGCPAVIRMLPARWRIDTDRKSGKVARRTHDLNEYTILNSCESYGLIFTFWWSCEVRRSFVSNVHPQYRLDSCAEIEPSNAGPSNTGPR